MPPQLVRAPLTRISIAAMPQTWRQARRCVRRARRNATTETISCAITIGAQKRTRGLTKKGGKIELAVVVTVTVTVSAAPDGLELATNGLMGSLVLTEHEDLGAFIEQLKNTKPVPLVNPGVNLLVFTTPPLSPALTVIGGGAGNTGRGTADALYWRT